jgi:hypothetical protein
MSEKLLLCVELVSDARTTPGERCVSAHRGWAGEIKPFFTISPAN